jgi:hypothetical protein
LIISVENNTSSPDEAVLAVRRINEKVADLYKMLDPVKVVREGGSGFAKIIAAVRYEFKQRDPAVEALAINERLIVTVKFEIAGLAI